MGLLTEEIENKIREMLPEKFGVIIDGWSEGSEHFKTTSPEAYSKFLM